MSPAGAGKGGVLFLLLNPAYVRNFESVLRTTAAREHRVRVLLEERKAGDCSGLALLKRLCSGEEDLSYELLSPVPLGARGRLRLVLQAALDYLRYFEPPYEDASRLRARALAFLPAGLERALAFGLRHAPPVRRVLAMAARRGARALGEDPAVRRELERRRPELLIVSPLLHFRSRQDDWVRAAHGLGIATMTCVYGWDHFTNKGLMHACPDRVAVWNEAQRQEAVVLHDAAPGSVVITGAWPYDRWLGRRPSRSRQELCRQLEMPADRPLILYACSSRFIAACERPAVARWLRAVRSAADPRLAGANVIVRPHHLNNDGWDDPSPIDLEGVTVFPANGADPVDEPSWDDYFDSIVLADAVVGINTSALLESAIGDRPALAYPGPDFHASQEALPHFRRLTGEAGCVGVSASMVQHVARLSEAIAEPSAERETRRRFVDTFIRPAEGRAAPTERVVETIEELLAGPRRG